MKYILPILKETDVILLAIALISIFFFFFYVKVKFQKTASSKAYGILFYSFVFYSIAALSYVLLNAMDHFFRLYNDAYVGYAWFFPICIIAALFGAVCGWLIYFAASRVAEPYAYKLLNLSLLIIAPAITFTLLIKPFHENLRMLSALPIVKAEPAHENTLHYTTLTEKPAQIFIPSMPALVHDSLDITVENGHSLRIQNKRNGYVYNYKTGQGGIEHVYACNLNHGQYLALLALSPPIAMQSTLLIFDKLGDCVLQQTYDDYPNRMSASADGRYLLLQQQEGDSLVFRTCIRVE